MLLMTPTMSAAVGAPAQADEEPTMLSIIHGIPGRAIDVYLNGEAALSDVAAEMVTDPLEIDAGEYDVVVVDAGDDPDTDEAIVEASDVRIPAGLNSTLVLHLDGEGDPSWSVFVNDVGPVADGNTRLVVRHVSSAPDVDVFADGEEVLTGFGPGDEAALELEPGPIEVELKLPGETEPAIGPVTLRLEPGTASFVHAIGDGADDLLPYTVVAQNLPLASTPPSVVNAGTGPVDEGSFPLMLLAGGLMAGGVVLFADSERRRRATAV